MAKNEESFALNVALEDLGFKQYGFVQGGKKSYYTETGERKKVWRSPASIYLFAVAGLLTFWFLYSLIAATVSDGARAILDYLDDFFALAVCLALIFLSVFKVWDKFARFALNHGLVRNRERRYVESGAEMMEATYEKLEKEPPVFEVYENYIRATDGETVKVFDRAQVTRIIAYRAHGQCIINMVLERGLSSEVIMLKDLRMPLREVNKLKAFFGDNLKIEALFSPAEEKENFKLDFDVNWVGIIMGLITLAAGGGVLALHYTLAESIPVALGAFFIAGGVLIACTGLLSLPLVKTFIIPLILGGILITIPWQFCKIIAEANGISLAFTGVDNFLSSFNPLFCAVAFLAAIGLFAAGAAFWGLFKYIKYKEY